MNETAESGQAIELSGKSGNRYTGKIYHDKNSTSAVTGSAIALLSNSTQSDEDWSHQVNSIYNTDDVANELAQFQNRDDISHLILLPYNENHNDIQDKVDDLIRSYLHR